MKKIVCPISDQRVNEQVTRINASLTIFLVVLALAVNSLFLMVFLALDFFIRAFTNLKYSPLSYLGIQLASAMNLPVKLTDKAPKIFASRLGFLMTTTIAVLYGLNFQVAANIVSSGLIFFAALEFACAICVGCLIYTYVVLPFYRNV